MKKIKFKQYKHQIKQAKLEKWNLNAKQIATVYSKRTKVEQMETAKMFKRVVKASRTRKFNTTTLGMWSLENRIQKYTDKARTIDLRKASKEELKVRKQLVRMIDKLTMQLLSARAYNAKTRQAKEDLKARRKEFYENKRALYNAGEYYINNTRKENYDKNETTNVSLEVYLKRVYSQEYDDLITGEYDKKKKEWIREPITPEEAIMILKDKAIAEKKLEKLQQGEGFGYIDDTRKEVISPV